ncbi:MAG: sel1 repeat family protein [Gammaproteobacteria bacterium]|nr:sel1 repeat family protein [Gammaproteobacteria bacterium]
MSRFSIKVARMALVLTFAAAGCRAATTSPQDAQWTLCRSDASHSKNALTPGFYLEDEINRRIAACQALLTADFKDPDVHFYLGRLLLQSIYGGKEKTHENQNKAVQEFRLGRAAGSTKATTALASLIDGDIPLIPSKNPWNESRALYEEAAARGDPIAQVEAAFKIGANPNGDMRDLRLPTPEEYQRILDLLQRASAQGNPKADYYLGMFYAYDSFADKSFKDVPRGVKYFKQAARKAHGDIRKQAVDELKHLGQNVSSYVVRNNPEADWEDQRITDPINRD